ncbi:type II secretion system protein [Campylobacter suis]|uniref:Type II secretion system protein n=1 Tax=Campylobacter suis TaxID=2790657 RepID=A0ABM8Q330_9BACT|nr:type II secretion system protein [Campylobacter suis]CAD7287254.1 hypothetical protein LMG8286_00892 [Campylobacter suis]
MRRAFSMIELVFVVVVIAILAGIMLPKISVSKDDAIIIKTRSEIAAIQSAISTQYSQTLLSANPNYPQTLQSTQLLFSAVLPIGIVDANGKEGWSKVGEGDENYVFKYKNSIANFKYDKTNGSFACVSGGLCSMLK